ncbi:hypothetical protein VNI00_014163 [Paramarasmius palmivorus]|uniref:Fungal-type protein kinase domain-containing protein n=1 Tax=Paramarasmius palmivorus TaxID=297713 RepID=A0AAW0BYQ1_9AGAR
MSLPALPAQPLLKSSPLKVRSMDTRLPHSTLSAATDIDRERRYKYVDNDLKDVYIGPVKPSDFLEKYFPGQGGDMPSFTGERKEAFVKVGDVMDPTKTNSANNDNEEASKRGEAKMYQPMVEAMAPYCPHFDIVNTSSSSDKHVPVHLIGEVSPDLVLYAKGSARRRNMDFRAMGLHVELKAKVDPFNDDPPTFEPKSDAAGQIRGQMASYAGAQMASQFRTHYFSVWARGNAARLIRWDRGGVVVTRKFDYAQEPCLAKFLWCFDGADLATQGYDTSVTVADKDNEMDAPYIEKAKSELGLPDNAIVVKFRVYDERTKSWRHFYGANLVDISSATPVGRCTRGFGVIDEDGKKVYLKDTWRIAEDGYNKESEVYYNDLGGIKSIPRVSAAGDVEGTWQKTVSHKWLPNERLRQGRFRRHHHYFIVFEDLGIPLTEFKDLKELVSAMKDALQAHTDAYEKGILHRDISTGNILIKPSGGGMLIDWEFAKSTMSKGARIMERTGTWQFMSVHLLTNTAGSVEHTLLDDLESFFHVLCYIVLVRCEHGLDQKAVKHHLRTVYDAWFSDDGDDSDETVVGGVDKGRAMKSFFIKGEAKLPDSPLRDLLIELEDVFASRYIGAPSQEARKEFEELVTEMNPSERQLEKMKNPVWIYDGKIAKLNQSSRWMLDLFNQALEDPRGLTAKPVVRPYLTTPYIRVRQTIHAMSENPSGTSKRKRDRKELQEGSESKKLKEAPSGSGSKRPRKEVTSGPGSKKPRQAKQ